MKPILSSLKSRLSWYEKALAMITGDSPCENGFGWPNVPGIPLPIGSARELYLDQYIMFLAGCIHELHNTIDMLNAKEETNP